MLYFSSRTKAVNPFIWKNPFIIINITVLIILQPRTDVCDCFYNRLVSHLQQGTQTKTLKKAQRPYKNKLGNLRWELLI